MKNIDDPLEILILDKKADSLFSGKSISVGSPNVFGGQVLAQSLHAAYNTITNGRIVHSLHCYFLEPGDLTRDIVFEVQILRDGGSFSTRRVTAIQNDKVIFIFAASFHKNEDGYEHQIEMKSFIKPPEELLSWSDLLQQFGNFLPKYTKQFLEINRPVEFKPVTLINPLDKKNLPPYNDVWFKLKGDTSSMPLDIKQQVLTYISDYNILATALYPHASKAHFGNTQMASLDHSMWFFRDFDFSDWLLFSIESPSSSNARGFTKGHIYSRNGELIASVAQEGLMRPKEK